MVAEHTVGGRILALRDSNGISQLDLAKTAGISTAALRNIEHGTALPRLSTLELLSDFFKVSLDYLVRGIAPTGDSGDGLDTQTLYRETGLNDDALYFLRDEMERAEECCTLNVRNEYIATLNALIAGGGLLRLVWGLNNLNKEIADIDGKIKKVLDETPKLKERGNIKKFSIQDAVKHKPQCDALDELEEQRDLLKWRYLRSVEKVFENHIAKGNDE